MLISTWAAPQAGGAGLPESTRRYHSSRRACRSSRLLAGVHPSGARQLPGHRPSHLRGVFRGLPADALEYARRGGTHFREAPALLMYLIAICAVAKGSSSLVVALRYFWDGVPTDQVIIGLHQILKSMRLRSSSSSFSRACTSSTLSP